MSYRLIRASADNTGLPDKSVHCVVTSPPYYGLRAYAGEQMIEWRTVRYSPMPGLPEITIQGCEPGCAHEWADGPTKTQTPQRDHDSSGGFGNTRGQESLRQGMSFKVTQGAYCIHCGGWRGGLGNEPTPEAFIGHLILVMREMWRVLRDDGVCWVNLGDSYNGSGGAGGDYGPGGIKEGQPKFPGRKVGTLKSKDLMMIPARFALAAQADGWYLRSDMPWIKRNPMPESAEDRPGKAIEYVFMLAKSEDYFFDQEAVKLPSRNFRNTDLFFRTWQGLLMDENPLALVVNTRGYSAAHFATWPPALVEPMIKAGTSAYGVCPQCQAPWVRMVEKTGGTIGKGSWVNHANDDTQGLTRRTGSKADEDFSTYKVTTTGWRPSCACDAGDPIPATVLDPFAGSGTSLKVAMQLGRSAIGVDISEEYLADLAPERLSNVQMVMSL